uniref:Uncharacterized protein LOC100183380 n=1 Tax=Phallusia mammillata TaxID=59560 RepID=A0A6F9DIK8_9ASCI|nr:uncharacterized protein LOC100183380 [Phallusia mammillata]
MAPDMAQKFPSISHPLSRLGSRESLSISGQSRNGAQSVDWSLRDPTPLPMSQPLEKLRSKSVAGSNTSERSFNCPSSQSGRRMGTDEILIILEDKLRSSNLHAVRNIFKCNDPNGEGKVSKEAFSRILWQLCGYLSPRQISHLMRRLGIDKKNYVVFDDLVNYFRRPSTHGGGGESHTNMVSSSHLLKPPNSAPERMTHERHSVTENETSSVKRFSTPRAAPESHVNVAARSWELLKNKAATGDLDFHSLFPPMVFGEGAYVIPGQLRECLHKLRIPSSDDIVAKIFRKFDGGSPFAVRSKKFFELLGLDPEGKRLPSSAKPPSGDSPRKRETPRAESVAVTKVLTPSSTPRPRPATSLSNGVTAQQVNEQRSVTSCGYESAGRPKTSLEVVATARLFDGDVAEYISKKLEEGQVHIQRALEAKDTNACGLISKPDLRDVFYILGIPLKPTNLEHFLARNGLRRSDGVVNYRLLLRRLQSRSNRSLLNKVMRNQDHVFHETNPPPTPAEGASAPVLEVKLLDIFQREFLAFLAACRQFDQNGTGFLTLDEFRSAIEARYTIKITDSAWEQFTSSSYVRLVNPPSNATQGQKGYVPYNDFLAKFDVMLRPSTADADDPWVEEIADMSHLREHKDRYVKSMDVDASTHTHRHEPRPLPQLEATLVDVLLYKFQNFKKEYDLIVREDFCRVDKEKFDYILFRCGFVLTPSELSALWLSMPITRPMESLSIPTIFQHVMRLYYGSIYPGKFNKQSRDSAIVTRVLEKIRVPIVSHWNLLKKKLRYLDPMGTSRIPKEDMLQIMHGLRPDVSELELHYLIEMLESRIPGKTNYFRLMEYYTKHAKRKVSQESSRRPLLSSDSERVPKQELKYPLPQQHHYRHPTPPQPEFINLRNAPSVSPFKRVTKQPKVSKSYPPNTVPMQEYRKNVVAKGNKATKARNSFEMYRGRLENIQRHPPSTASKDSGYASPPAVPQMGAKELSSIGRALRKEDVGERGRIPVEAFRKVLAAYGMSFRNPDEIYKLLSTYDRKMRDEVSYEKFLTAMS